MAPQILQENATKIIKFSHAANIFIALHIAFSTTSHNLRLFSYFLISRLLFITFEFWFCYRHCCCCCCWNFCISCSSCKDIAVNFFPIRSWMSKYFATHRSKQTDSPLVSSPSLYFVAIHFLWHAPVNLLIKDKENVWRNYWDQVVTKNIRFQRLYLSGSFYVQDQVWICTLNLVSHFERTTLKTRCLSAKFERNLLWKFLNLEETHRVLLITHWLFFQTLGNKVGKLCLSFSGQPTLLFLMFSGG